jgi:hypothetical protein
MRTSTQRYPRPLALAISALFALAALAPAEHAAAFCGFYVTGADANLYANATMVVLMRDGTRTVLSMQNNYQGPPDAFALVIPVPTVLQKENVKVLSKEVFQRVDSLGAPRLVEYWEVDPCRPPIAATVALGGAAPPAASPSAAAGSAASAVRIEAQFAVGEYDVVVLSADDSSALDTWLRDNKYNIPSGAGPVLAPYVAAGMKFFVAKVDTTRVTFNGDQAALSPLRFYYDTPDFSLPVRLGLLNSQGSQDLIVNILAPQRYEVANYPNATVATNIRVHDDVRNDFASFYEALYSRVLEKNPQAVVTEYAWASGSCDPCPTPPLGQQDLLTLGADVLQTANASGAQPTPPANGGAAPAQQGIAPGGYVGNFTLTRLHARYTKDMLGEDLVFRSAQGILGGRGIPDPKGNLDQSVMPTGGDYSNFQGRYVILHAWEGALSCQNPQRGQWGGPSGTMGSAPQAQAQKNNALLGGAPTAGDLPSLLAESLPALDVSAKTPVSPLTPTVVAVTGGSSAAGAKAQPIKIPVAGSKAGAAGAKAAAPSVTPANTAKTASDVPASPPPLKRNSGCAVAPGADPDNGLLFAGLLVGGVFFAGRLSRRAGRKP